MSVPHEIVPYESEKHGAFVRASWCRGARQPWPVLADLLRRPDTTCAVAHLPGDPDSLLGWAAVHQGAIVWAYTRSLDGELRRKGLATALLARLVVLPLGAPAFGEPIRCLNWSPHAAAIARAGHWKIYYDPADGVIRCSLSDGKEIRCA